MICDCESVPVLWLVCEIPSIKLNGHTRHHYLSHDPYDVSGTHSAIL